MAMHLNNACAIIPTMNMISNVGISEDSVHNVSDIKYVPKGLRRIFNMKTYDIDTDHLKHPKYMLVNRAYQKTLFRIMGRNSVIKAFMWRVESKLRRKFL